MHRRGERWRANRECRQRPASPLRRSVNVVVDLAREVLGNAPQFVFRDHASQAVRDSGDARDSSRRAHGPRGSGRPTFRFLCRASHTQFKNNKELPRAFLITRDVQEVICVDPGFGSGSSRSAPPSGSTRYAGGRSLKHYAYRGHIRAPLRRPTGFRRACRLGANPRL